MTKKLNKAQKRRVKQKAKKKASKEQAIKQKGNWVEDRLEWISFEDFHRKEEAVADDVEGKDDAVRIDTSDDDASDAKSEASAASNEKEEEPEDPNSIKIISWNVLADSYCNRSSHRDLPAKYQSVVFDRKRRPQLVRKTLRHLSSKLRPDFFALQEVDPPLGIAKLMNEELEYGVAETIACKDGRNGRVDSCGLYYRKSTWTCLEQKTIRLDDLAVLRSGTVEDDDKVTRKLYSRSSSSFGDDKRNGRSNSLQGLQCSFIRKNVTLLARMEHNVTKQRVVVVVAHLFWNPYYEYVKLCQMHYITERVREFCKNNEPVILCGDFNSQPKSSVHQYLTKGKVNAKSFAPWYAVNRSVKRQQSTNTNDETSDDNTPTIEKLTSDLTSLNMEQSKGDYGTGDSTSVKYMLDFTLNKFCRWMRILGLDVALETEEEERERTKNGNPVIFRKCRDEGRVLVTTSSKLVQRKDCPAGTYLLDPQGSLDQTLVHLLLSHGIKIEPSTMLTRCVVCNGSIKEVHDKQKMKDIFRAHKAPDGIGDEVLGVYQCDGCGQGYWWCDKPTSSASRVKSQATRLLELCVRGGVPIGEDMGLFDYINVEEIRKEMNGDVDQVEERLDIVKWLQDEELKNPLRSMSNAYASPDTGEESLPFTNVTSCFVGHLDYIMYQTDHMKVDALMYIPRRNEELNDLEIPNGHLLPSCHWPSDHLAIGCRLNLQSQEKTAETKDTTEETKQADDMWCAPTGNAPPPPILEKHPDRCACGCVPPIPSLFEMAELRKQARLKKQQAVQT